MDWLKRNKTITGLILGAFAVYVKYKCPFIPHEYCDKVDYTLGMITTFLIGAGAVDSDIRQRYVQGHEVPKSEEK